ncbi:2-amino-3-carboxymuconate-6-semialdehyde decarboxylase [Klebsiella pneumoniae]|uniref:2-amino-3-carboxymuconate-6-semialdehyde decarboxylase n=1 Tax=Klebsiella pneumoniae TaxID=573 RepID=A0A378AYB2_KLEPN|nr:2-amino-3-carboxymuconate-6-semialdehyde decarboxylase [Klebsiella pneumoniae]
MKKLGMKGALINGYTNVKDSEHGLYLDDESMLVFWDKVNELNVPVYCILVNRWKPGAWHLYRLRKPDRLCLGLRSGNGSACYSSDDERFVRSLS